MIELNQLKEKFGHSKKLCFATIRNSVWRLLKFALIFSIYGIRNKSVDSESH